MKKAKSKSKTEGKKSTRKALTIQDLKNLVGGSIRPAMCTGSKIYNNQGQVVWESSHNV